MCECVYKCVAVSAFACVCMPVLNLQTVLFCPSRTDQCSSEWFEN